MNPLQEALTHVILEQGSQYEYNEKVDTLLNQFFDTAESFSYLLTEFRKISSAAESFGFQLKANKDIIFFYSPLTKFAIKVSPGSQILATEIDFIKDGLNRDNNADDFSTFEKLQALPSNASLSSIEQVIGKDSLANYIDWNFYSDNFGGDSMSVNYAPNKDFIYGFGEYAY